MPPEHAPKPPASIQTLGDLRAHFDRYYEELNAIARQKLRFERSGHTLDTSALVHEIFEKLHHQRAVHFQNKDHFLAIASMAMRRVLVNYARDCQRLKRGGHLVKMSYGNVQIPLETTPEEILSLNEALTSLRKLNKRQSRIVEYYIFGGFKHQEIAEYLGLSVDTIRKEWRMARAWLSLQLKSGLV